MGASYGKTRRRGRAKWLNVYADASKPTGQAIAKHACDTRKAAALAAKRNKRPLLYRIRVRWYLAPAELHPSTQNKFAISELRN